MLNNQLQKVIDKPIWHEHLEVHYRINIFPQIINIHSNKSGIRRHCKKKRRDAGLHGVAEKPTGKTRTLNTKKKIKKSDQKN